jgi:Lipocalin-like domain
MKLARKHARKFSQITAAGLALALSLGNAAAQQGLREKLIGTWTFVVAEITAPDGKKSFPFGETPKGLLIFTADGHFSQIHIASDVPKIASNNRLNGTAEEYAAIMRRSLSMFGTYKVDEAKRTVTFEIVSSTYPNAQGQSQLRTIDKLTDEEFVNSNPEVGGGRGSAFNLYKRVK